jgi:hypothetical protein
VGCTYIVIGHNMSVCFEFDLIVYQIVMYS